MKQASLVVALLFLFLSQAGLAETVWEQHGVLEVSKSGHTIQYADGTPFLWIGDTGWGMFQQLTREQVDAYLEHRQALGFTVIQSVAHWSPHGGGMDRGTNNAANAYGHRPFSGGESSPNTSEPLVVAGGSPQAPNDYWDNVDYVVEAVRKRGMYLALLPTWGATMITGSGEYTVDEAKAYGQFLGKRYRDVPNIVWVLGGDTKAQLNGYDKNQVFQDFDYRPVYRAMAEGLVSGTTGQDPNWNENHDAWDKLFMTYHPDGDAPYNSSNWFHKDAWLDANGVEVWKEVDEVYRTMINDYQLVDPIKPSLFLEGSYEYGTYRHECGWVTPVRVRRQFYHTFFAGSAGHTYGAGPIWSMRGSGGDYNCGYTWQQALHFPAAAQIATVAKEFLIEHEWSEWVPDGRVLQGYGAVGEKENLKTGVTSANGDMALVYFSNNSETRVKNTLGHAAGAYWFDPRDGSEVAVEKFDKNEVRSMVPPDRWEDAILVLRASQ